MTDKLSPTVLLPCPFCGSEPELKATFFELQPQVRCDCGAKMWAYSEDEASAQWNTRTSPAPTGGVVTDAVGEALFNLSDSLRPYLASDDKMHERYEAVVSAWQSLADATPSLSEAADLRAEAEFLCARVRELEGDMPEGPWADQYYGHVIPALKRMEALAMHSLSAPTDEGGEG